jgi:hypothetical protein
LLKFNKLEMNWFQHIYEGIKFTFDKAKPAFPSIPTLLLICEASERSGISAMSLASNIIRRLPEIGIPTGANPDGSQNLITGFVRIFSEELVKEFKDNAQIECALQAGGVTSQGVGTNAGGSVTVTSTNILPFSLKGILK